ncbi:MAG: homoserine kinase [Actinobacteria bacterium]|nr:homoserine kinase [Actinomycetota bacterium]
MVEVVVPATVANLGPGFDVLGIAINLYNRFKVSEIDNGLEIELMHGGGLNLPTDDKNLVFISAKRLFDEVGYRFKGLSIGIENGVPIGRGLGSSSTAIVGGISAANEISGAKLSKDEVFDLATKIEGHPDNVGPAIFGGFTICYQAGSSYNAVSYRPSDNLRPVLLIPNAMLETEKARAVLPSSISISNAVFNIGRSSLLVSALLTGRSDLLREAMEDKLHQPYRAPLIPGLVDMIRGVSCLGGVGIALSGAGPSLICIVEKAGEGEFYEQIRGLLKDRNQGYTIQPVEFDLRGARVVGMQADIDKVI